MTFKDKISSWNQSSFGPVTISTASYRSLICSSCCGSSRPAWGNVWVGPVPGLEVAPESFQVDRREVRPDAFPQPPLPLCCAGAARLAELVPEMFSSNPPEKEEEEEEESFSHSCCNPTISSCNGEGRPRKDSLMCHVTILWFLKLPTTFGIVLFTFFIYRLYFSRGGRIKENNSWFIYSWEKTVHSQHTFKEKTWA